MVWKWHVFVEGLFDKFRCLKAWTLWGKGPGCILEAPVHEGCTIWYCVLAFVFLQLFWLMFCSCSEVFLIEEEFMWCLRCTKFWIILLTKLKLGLLPRFMLFCMRMILWASQTMVVGYALLSEFSHWLNVLCLHASYFVLLVGSFLYNCDLI